jgi:hypothetical protein
MAVAQALCARELPWHRRPFGDALVNRKIAAYQPIPTASKLEPCETAGTDTLVPVGHNSWPDGITRRNIDKLPPYLAKEGVALRIIEPPATVPGSPTTHWDKENRRPIAPQHNDDSPVTPGAWKLPVFGGKLSQDSGVQTRTDCIGARAVPVKCHKSATPSSKPPRFLVIPAGWRVCRMAK